MMCLWSHFTILTRLSLLNGIRATDCVSGVEQFLLHLLLLAFDPVHAVLVLVEL